MDEYRTADRALRVGETARQRAFDTLAAPLRDFLFRVALRLTRHPQDAEDAVQEAFLKAYRGFAGFRPGTDFKPWIFRILKNHLINQYRKRSAEPVHSGCEAMEAVPAFHPAAACDDPAALALRSLTVQAIRAAIASLPGEYRAAVTLAHVEGDPYREIARKLDCPVGTVRSRLHRGRERVRASLREEIAGAP